MNKNKSHKTFKIKRSLKNRFYTSLVFLGSFYLIYPVFFVSNLPIIYRLYISLYIVMGILFAHFIKRKISFYDGKFELYSFLGKRTYSKADFKRIERTEDMVKLIGHTDKVLVIISLDWFELTDREEVKSLFSNFSSK